MCPHFSFLRYCLDNSQDVPVSIQDVDWNGLFSFMQQQALLGVGFHGASRLKSSGVDIPKPLFLKWFALSERIKRQNELLNSRSSEIVCQLATEGVRCCILKGQGNAVMYPDSFMRTPGDIDVWADGSRQRIMELVRGRFPMTLLRYHHVDYPIFKDADVELHFIPSTMNNPFFNGRLREWFENNKEQQLCNLVQLPNAEHVPVPTPAFNVVYQLSHLMHHFFDEGIGLRQMMDYYYVLRSYGGSSMECDVASTLRRLNLFRFAGAVMYVMREVFGLEESLLIIPVDERRGRTLLGEILKGGNFGQHSGLTRHSTGMKYFLKIRRNLRFAGEYPCEALCEPVFRTWHFFWRLFHRR